MARREHSAGTIIFRNSATAPRQYLLLDHGKHWDFPKGHLKRDETDAQAALRELEEETGIIDVDLIPGFQHKIRYFFRSSKTRLIDKTVVFFLASTSTDIVTLSDEHVAYAFLNYPDALTRLTYPTAREVLRLAEQFLLARETNTGQIDAHELLSPTTPGYFIVT